MASRNILPATKTYQQQGKQRSAQKDSFASQISPLNYPTVPNLYHKHQENHYSNSPKLQVTNINNLRSVFRHFGEQQKYDGKIDFLYQRLKVFYDICETFDLPKQKFYSVFPAILIGAAHDYYYD